MALDAKGKRKPLARMIQVRCTLEFFADLERAAGRAGDNTVSEFLRRAATERAARFNVTLRR